ncbi:HAD family hydrolase [Arthrobacter sp. UM1]|uniref:HAD family hydrolase n=1 Tax=Arthrobacter sp. UM1 TaxID=2766776 RepID=UPI001CF6BE80|nr:HAD family hydrolase [Arthrobacter sp. UM1]
MPSLSVLRPPRSDQSARSPRPVRRPQLAVLDMAGTTVDDGLIQEDCLREVLDAHGIAAGSEAESEVQRLWRQAHGTSRFGVFRSLFHDDVSTAHQANRRFEDRYDELVRERGVRPVEGAADAIAWLRSEGVLVCLATGLARHTQNTILESLGWMGLADLSLCPSDAGRGRPSPDIVLTAVLALDVDDVREVVVVGDTPNDMTAGLRSGASDVVGVTTGAFSAGELWDAGATDVMDSVAGLPGLLSGERG